MHASRDVGMAVLNKRVRAKGIFVTRKKKDQHQPHLSATASTVAIWMIGSCEHDQNQTI